MNIFNKLEVGDIVVYTYRWSNHILDYSYGEVTDITEVDGKIETTIKDILCYRKKDNKLYKEKGIIDTIEGDSYKDCYTFFSINDDRFNESMSMQEFITTMENLFPEYFI